MLKGMDIGLDKKDRDEGITKKGRGVTENIIWRQTKEEKE